MLSQSKVSGFICSGIILIVTLICFSRGLQADFVMWDDDWMIYQNPQLADQSFQNYVQAFTEISSNLRYAPLNTIQYLITYRFFGVNPFGYHVIPWILHGFNAMILFWIFRRILELFMARYKTEVSSVLVDVVVTLGVLFWAIHPLRVEVVTWASANFYVLVAFFFYLSVLFYLYLFLRDPARRIWSLLPTMVCYFISLMFHPVAVMGVIVFLLLDYCFNKEANPAASASIRKVVIENIPLLATALVFCLITMSVRFFFVDESYRPNPLADYGYMDYLRQSFLSWLYYIGAPLIPVHLSPVYINAKVFSLTSLPVIVGLWVLAGLFWLTLLHRNLRKFILITLIGFSALALPVLGFTYDRHAPCDRYVMLPSLIWSVWWMGMFVFVRNKKIIQLMIMVCGLVVFTMFWLSQQQIHIWKNTNTLFDYIIATVNDEERRNDIYFRYGHYYSQQGNTAEAIRYFENVLASDPEHYQTRAHYGELLARQGSYAEAVEQLEYALKYSDPRLNDTLHNLGAVYVKLKQYDQALNQFEYLKNDAFKREDLESVQKYSAIIEKIEKK